MACCVAPKGLLMIFPLPGRSRQWNGSFCARGLSVIVCGLCENGKSAKASSDNFWFQDSLANPSGSTVNAESGASLSWPLTRPFRFLNVEERNGPWSTAPYHPRSFHFHFLWTFLSLTACNSWSWMSCLSVSNCCWVGSKQTFYA